MRSKFTILLGASLIGFLQASIVCGESPANDNLADAIVIGDGTVSGTTLEATKDGQASCANSSTSPDVWYKYTAACSGYVTFDSCGSSFDTVLAVYSAAAGMVFDSGGFENETPDTRPSNPVLGTWNLRADDGVNEQVFGLDSEGGPGAYRGSQYLYVGHDGVSGVAGGAAAALDGLTSGMIEVEFALYLPEIRTDNGVHVQMNFGNDSTGTSFGSCVTWLGAAHPLDVEYGLGIGPPGTPAGEAVLVRYTTSWGYVTSGGGASRMSVPYDQWNEVTINFDLDAHTYTITVNGLTSDPLPQGQELPANSFAIFTNTDAGTGTPNQIYVDDLVIGDTGNELACNNDCSGSPCGGLDSCVTVPMSEGDTVLLRVSGADGASGDFTVNVSCSTSVPVNNDCADATVITEATIPGTTLGATNDGSTTCGPSDTSPDVWYSYTASEAGTLYVSMAGTSGFVETVLSVHSGCPGNADNTLACNSGASQSGVVIPVEGEQTYLIRASGANGAEGDFVLDTNLLPLPPPQEDLEQMLSIEWHIGERLPREFQDSDGGIIHNKLVSACGFTTTSVFFDDVFTLDLDNREAGWTTVAHYPVAPLQELFSVVIDNEIYYWGGFSYSAPYAYNEGYKLSYNPTTDEWIWTELPSLPWKVCSSGIAVIGTKIYVHGGADYDLNAFFTFTDRYGGNENLGSHLLVLDINDMASGWQQLPDCPGTPRWVHTMSAVNDKLYVIGGATGSPYCTTVDNWVFDPATTTWSRLPDLPISSGNFPNGNNIIFQNRYIILVGGYQYSCAYNNRVEIAPYGQGSHSEQPNTSYFADVFVYDTATDRFGRAEDLPLNNNLPMTVVQGNEIFLMGGETGGAWLTDYPEGAAYAPDGEYYAHRPDLFMIGTIEEYQEPNQCGDKNHPYPQGDYNKDCVVNMYDFAWLAQRWLQPVSPSLAVENWSFETPDVPAGTREVYGNHPGWTTSCGMGYVDERDWLFTTGFNPPDPNRPQWLTMEDMGCEAYQTLDHIIEANTAYTLTVDIGMASWLPHWEYSDYHIKLVAADTGDMIAETDESAGLPALDTYITISATGTTGDDSDVRVGQPLKIVLVNAANPADPGIVIYDNVRVTWSGGDPYGWEDLALMTQYWLEDSRP